MAAGLGPQLKRKPLGGSDTTTMLMTKPRRTRPATFEYDVCLSFAGENRVYVRAVADALRTRGVRVFFDEYARVDIWGKDLYTHLDDIYQDAARFCVLFASKHYARRVWTNHEREAAQARAIRNHSEYILPARFDNTRIPGVRSTVGHVSLRRMKPTELATLIVQKVGPRQIEDYFPPIPDRLFAAAKVRSQKAREITEARARDFFTALRRMNEDERRVVALVFVGTCPDGLPDNVHMDLDLLRRLSGFPESKIVRLLSGIGSLGFFCSVKTHPPGAGNLGRQRVVKIEWHDLTADDDIGGNATEDGARIAELVSGDYCEEHGFQPFVRLDFSRLATSASD